jgi:hypothetical protein
MAPETARDQGSFQDEVDVKVITNLIRAMSMAASKLLAYPDGHPFVVESFQRVENILQGIFGSQSQLTFKIAKNTIMWGSTVLDEKSPVFQRFAQTLFEHGIVGLILQKGLVTKELMDFDAIILQKRNDIYQQGGISALISKANIGHIQTKLIDYGLFQKQEGIEKEEENKEGLRYPSFWQSFVRGIFEKTLDPHGRNHEPSIDIDPEQLATILNDKHLDGESNAQDGLRVAFRSGMEHLDLNQLTGDEELTKRLFRFIKSLNGELRQNFMEAFFNSLPDDNDAANKILSGLPDEIILDALERYTNQGVYIPPNVLKVLQKLAKTSTNPIPEGMDELLNSLSRDELVDKLKTVFKEDEADRFLPQDYQKILGDVVAAENISAAELSEVLQLEKILTDQTISASVTAVTVEMIAAYGDSEAIPDVLIQSLKDRCSSLISSGDFRTVLTILERIGKKKVRFENDTEAPLKNLIEVFSNESFTHEVLEASRQWGKEKHPDTKKLIMFIGPPFIDPLLDLLADEESRVLRLYYLDILRELGEAVRDPAVRRLSDRRWYVIRNLLVILRYLNDPSILNSIRSLFGHSHTRVRQEALHTLLALGDPKADRILLNEMNSSDGDRCINAIILAGMTQNREVTQKLAEFLKKKGLGKTSFEIKKASVHALADIGDTSILPSLQDVLKSFSLFFRRKSHLLKIEIIDSLGKYPAAEAAPILKNIARGRPAVLANRALLVMKTLEVDEA